jgi:RNA polymerase sigma-70 factor (ECF subfamily)
VSSAAIRVGGVETRTGASLAGAGAKRPLLDSDSRAWLADLRREGSVREDAVARLHALLLRAALFEVSRRRPILPHLRGNDLEDIANQAADDALVSVLARLDDFRGESRFTTWAYKFALLEAAVKLRRRAWQGREVPLEPESWALIGSDGIAPDEEAEQGELLQGIQDAIETVLTPHQRKVLVALAVNGVPIDVLAERLTTTRGALYKTLHDARQKLRRHLADTGLGLEGWIEEGSVNGTA